jgi:hypothetical protein
MRNSAILSALLFAASSLAQIPGETLTGTAGNTTIAGSNASPNSDGKYVIQGIGIRANFIPYGASISNLFINDTSGVERDIVGGFDNASYYSIVSFLISMRRGWGGWVVGKGADKNRTANTLISAAYQDAMQIASRTAVL